MAVTARLMDIFELGDDALDTEGVVMITDEGGDTSSSLTQSDTDNSNIYGTASALTFRATAYTIPAMNIATYTVNYRGDKFTRPKAGNSADTLTMTISFRVDKYWKIYNALRKWKNSVANNYTGVDYGDSASSNRKIIYISTVDSMGNETGEHWTFRKAIITQLNAINLDQASDGTPITATATFAFLTVDHDHTDVSATDQTVPDSALEENDSGSSTNE